MTTDAELIAKSLSDAQKTAIRTLSINGTSTKASSAIRALVRKGLVSEHERFEAKSIFRLTAAGEKVVKALRWSEAVADAKDILNAIGSD